MVLDRSGCTKLYIYIILDPQKVFTDRYFEMVLRLRPDV